MPFWFGEMLTGINLIYDSMWNFFSVFPLYFNFLLYLYPSINHFLFSFETKPSWASNSMCITVPYSSYISRLSNVSDFSHCFSMEILSTWRYPFKEPVLQNNMRCRYVKPKTTQHKIQILGKFIDNIEIYSNID